ncbi:MAG: hypothetical protein AAFX09_00090 [Pseudomonadota bacterium]
MVKNSTKTTGAAGGAPDWDAILDAYERGAPEEALRAQSRLEPEVFRQHLRARWEAGASKRIARAMSALRDKLVAHVETMSDDEPGETDRKARSAAVILKLLNGMQDLHDELRPDADDELEFDESTTALDRFHAELERRIRRIAAGYGPDELRDWAGSPRDQTPA